MRKGINLKKILFPVIILIAITAGILIFIKSFIKEPPAIIEVNKQRTVEIDYGANGYIPTPAFIKVGDTVNFKNLGKSDMWPASNPHPAHTDYPEFNAKKSYKTGEIYSFMFTKSGVWGYHDHLKPAHTATITVK